MTSPDRTYRKTTLNNGLRIVTEKMPSVRSVTLGVWIDVGSRFEEPEENGISHLIEHMLFKGTHTRTPQEIALALESVGGNLNAFTSREYTCYTAHILEEHLEVAIEVLADMLADSTISPVNLNREKMVICEEIKEAEENPGDYIHELFSRTFWGQHPLGKPVLGTRKTVTNINRSRVLEYFNRHYRSQSVVVAAVGKVNHTKLVQLAKKYFLFLDGTSEPPQAAYRDNSPGVTVETNDHNQTHLCLGYPGISYVDSDKLAMLALHTYLGGGSSSVLFQKIREAKGLAYSLYTFHDFFRDSGVFGIYLGTDKTRLRQALEIILTEFRKMKKRRISGSRLDKIKTQLKGQMALAMESPNSRMNRLAREELRNQPRKPVEKFLSEIDNITSSQILELSNCIFDDNELTVAVLGPVDEDVFDGLIPKR